MAKPPNSLTANLDKLIYEVRGQRVMLDSDLAEIYDVSTKRLLEQVRRNLDRFPRDFAFQITRGEYQVLRPQIATLKTGRGQHRKYLPFVFTEHGALMAANVLKELKQRLDVHEAAIVTILQRIMDIIDPPAPPPAPSKPRIGFRL